MCDESQTVDGTTAWRVAMTDCHPECRASDPDRILRALAHADRRAVLESLATDDGERLAVETLAKRLEAVPKAELRHRHLPVLEEAGLVAFDPERACVEFTPTAAATAILETVDENFE